jgi:LysR family hydrogen peroxide-inducible transcriptional activator
VPLKPTPLGEEIIEKAKKVLREVDGIQDFVVQKKNTLDGTLRLGVVSTLSPYLVPLFIEALRAATPKVQYVIKEFSTVQLMKELESGGLDVALMATPTGNAQLKEFPLFLEPFVACLNPSHPHAGNEFYRLNERDKQSLLLLQNEFCYNAQLLEVCSLGKHRQATGVSYDINSIETLKNMVRADLGFAIVPWLSVMNEKEGVCYKPFKDPQPVREISLVVADTFSRKLLLEKISGVITDCLPKNLKRVFKNKKIKWNDSPYFARHSKE